MNNIYILLFCIGILNYGCKKNKDIDGNKYKTVKIGDQVWMAENLKVTHYKNGEPITEIENSSTWSLNQSGAFCFYNNDQTYSDANGALYNWYAVNDPRGIAPKGWHVPTLEEFETLIIYLGDESTTGGKMKESGTNNWNSPNAGATNESGFTAIPSGSRSGTTGVFGGIGLSTFFWCSTEMAPYDAYYKKLSSNNSSITYHNLEGFKSKGYSIRCIKD